MSNVIHSRDMGSIRAVMWRGQEVYSRFEQIVALVSARISPQCAQLFSKPVITDEALRRRGAAIWVSDHFRNPVPFDTLPDDRKAHCQQVLEEQVRAVTALGRSLQSSASAEDREIGEILEVAVEVPDIDCVLAENDSVVLVCWGFQPSGPGRGRFRLLAALSRDVPPEVVGESGGEVVSPAPPVAPVPQPLASRQGLGRWALLSVLLLTAAVAGGAYWYLLPSRERLPEEPGFAAADPAQIGVADDDPLKRQTVLNRLLLGIRDGADIVVVMKRINSAFAAEGVKVVGFRPETGVIQIEFAAQRRESVKALVRTDPDVERVIADVVLAPNLLPNDEAFNDRSPGASKVWGQVAIDAPGAWSAARGKPSVRIAVVDSDFAVGHPEFAAKTPTTFDAVTRKAQIKARGNGHGHGTHVAAIATAMADNGVGIAGVCSGCAVMLINVGQGETLVASAVADAIIHAVDAGAKIVNLSLGRALPAQLEGKTPDQMRAALPAIRKATDDEAAMWERVYTYAARGGALLVMAAGNEDAPVEMDPMKRSALPLYVGALGPDRKRAPFSNYGASVAISAPGVDIYSALPPDGFGRMSGTSQASPFVAGAAGLLLSVNERLTPAELRRILVETATPVENPGDGRAFGPLLNVAHAVAKAMPTQARQTETIQTPACSCDALQQRVGELERRVAELERRLDGVSRARLTLPETPQADFSFAAGRWRASKNLVRTGDGKPIEIVFSIDRNGTGKVDYVQASEHCVADLGLQFSTNRLSIDQRDIARCDGSGRTYHRMNYVCTADGDRAAKCQGKRVDGGDGAIINFQMEREN